MGAVKIDTYNQPLMYLANYSDKKCLKSLLKNFKNLKQMAEKGDTVAAAIYVDLKVALESDVLTKLQRYCVINYFINNDTLKDLAGDLDRDTSTISEHINGGLKRIQRALENGSLYRR